MKLSIIVPCYNEEAGIPNLAEKLIPILTKLSNTYSVELIFVDDGSTDNTFMLLGRYFKSVQNFRIIKHKKNMNLGAAMQTGFSAAKGDIIITMDSDCTYEPSTILKMLPMLDENTDIVTVSPYHPEGKVENVTKYRLFLSQSVSFIYSLLLPAKRIYTYTALNRVYKRHVLDNITFHSKNFLATAEILIRAMLKGYVVAELPAIVHGRKYGVSKMKLILVIRSHFAFILKLLFFRMGLCKL